MSKKITQRHTREQQTLVRHNAIPELKEPTQRVKLQNIKREVVKMPQFSSPVLLNQVKSFTTQRDKHYYLGFGGLGDALLLMATCWQDSQAKVVFFANQIPFIRSFFDLFGISAYMHDNIMGTKIAEHIYEYMKGLPGFRESAHLADRLDFNDWRDENKYVPRIRGKTTWLQHLGKAEFDKPVLILAPSGSHKDIKRQRYLTNDEYRCIVEKYLKKGYKVYATGSMNDLHHFGVIDNEDFFWLNSDRIVDSKNATKPINITNMLRIINSAEHVISMDTWLKTYTLLCDIPTSVIETRWEGNYRGHGDDITDCIFLNKKIWPNLRVIRVTDLLAS